MTNFPQTTLAKRTRENKKELEKIMTDNSKELPEWEDQINYIDQDTQDVEYGLNKRDWDRVKDVIRIAVARAKKAGAEEERERIKEIEISTPQTTYKNVFERVAFNQGFKSAIEIFKEFISLTSTKEER